MSHGLTGGTHELDPGAEVGQRRREPFARGGIVRFARERSPEGIRRFRKHPVRLYTKHDVVILIAHTRIKINFSPEIKFRALDTPADDSAVLE